MSAQSGKILSRITYASPQDRADKMVPIGWCNFCVAEAKAAQGAGRPAEEIHAAVTQVATVQQVNVPGLGVQTVIVTLPVCFARHCGSAASSSLLAGRL